MDGGNCGDPGGGSGRERDPLPDAEHARAVIELAVRLAVANASNRTGIGVGRITEALVAELLYEVRNPSLGWAFARLAPKEDPRE